MILLKKMEDPLSLPSPLTLRFKNTIKEFELKNFFSIYSITSLQLFWQVYQNSDFNTLIQHGSLFLSKSSPIWEEECGTYSFIVTLFERTVEEVWTDLSLFYCQEMLRGNQNIEGISVTLKGFKNHILNLKVCVRKEENMEKWELPSYFEQPRFALNGERQKVFKESQQNKKPPPLPSHQHRSGGRQQPRQQQPRQQRRKQKY